MSLTGDNRSFFRWPVWCLLFFWCPLQAQDNDSIPDQMIQLPKMKGTTYEILNLISEQSGFLFIYESEVIQSDRNIKVSPGRYSVKEAIDLAVGESVRAKILGQHILLFKPSEPPPVATAATVPVVPSTHIMLEGTVRDKETGEPLSYCSVGTVESAIGTVTNQNGQFLLKLPDSLQNDYIRISHLGYEIQRFPVSLLLESKVDIYLNTRYFPLEAVIIRLVNPQKIVRDMLEHRTHNYFSQPIYLTTFYREGVDRKKGFSNLTEAVFRIYKPGYSSLQADQVKLEKMRTISNEKSSDTLVMKMKAGVNASLMLDIVKNLPDFLILNEENMYHYTKISMAVTGDRLAHVIAFEQKPGIVGPLYKGELYIDESNYALLQANFQIHPAYIEQAHSIFIVKKSNHIEITPQEASYSVSYQELNGKYYVKHARGDLRFRIRKKRQLFPETVNAHTYFEMASCDIDTLNVKRFPVRESQPTRNIFSETKYVYDDTFWGDFNIILPEEKLSEAISRISSKIEESINND